MHTRAKGRIVIDTALQECPGGGWRCNLDPGEPTTGRKRISIAEEECRLLSILATKRNVLEIGTGLGVSTCALAATAAHVTTIDPDPWVREQIAPDLPNNVTATTCLEQSGMYDLAFIDGDHSLAAVQHDVSAAFQMVTANGLIVAHDSHDPTVRRALGDGWYFVGTTFGLAIRVV